MNKFFFDKIISLKLYKTRSIDNNKEVLDTNPLNVVTIDTNDAGLKPDIEFEIGELPGQSCYDCTVKVHNLMYMPAIREYKFMSISAGYKYGESYFQSRIETYTIAIFTAYQESPNPDGTTTFRGLTVGQIEGFLTTQSIHFVTYQSLPFADFLYRAMLGASGYVDAAEYHKARAQGDVGLIRIYNYIPESVTRSIRIPPQQIIASNGQAFLSKVYEILKSIFNNLNYTYVQQLFNGQLNVGLLECSSQLTTAEPVIDITAVYSASFTASILNIVAPWNPSCIPGAIVRISPHYFVGQQAPNSLGDLVASARSQALISAGILSPEEIRTGEGIYRILITHISFASCRETNKMELTLLPITYLERDTNAEAEMSKIYENLKSTVENYDNKLEIEIGVKPTDKSTTKVWEGNLKGSYSSMDYVTYKYGMTFSDIAKQCFCKNYGLDEDTVLWKSKSEYNKDYIVDIKDDGSLVKGRNSSLKIGIRVGRANAWPIILKATYSQYKSTRDEAYKVDLNDPDTLPAQTKACIPGLPTDNKNAIASLEPDKELFKTMGDYYLAHMSATKPWAKESAIRMYNMYLLLGGSL